MKSLFRMIALLLTASLLIGCADKANKAESKGTATEPDAKAKLGTPEAGASQTEKAEEAI